MRVGSRKRIDDMAAWRDRQITAGKDGAKPRENSTPAAEVSKTDIATSVSTNRRSRRAARKQTFIDPGIDNEPRRVDDDREKLIFSP